MEFRIERDTLGEVSVPVDRLWGAQTQRSLENFTIGDALMPIEVVRAIALTKKAAAYANADLGVLPADKRDLIAQVCDEILEGQHDDQFPLRIWQTGSGTQTNMNVNEVIANRAELLRGGSLTTEQKYLSPNDDVNKSQSTNDVFPTAMRIAAAKILREQLIPSLVVFIATIYRKILDFKHIKKIGRTHLMDATPLTLGQEFSAYRTQMENCWGVLSNSLEHVQQLPIGGTAVGTGLNAPKGYDELAVKYINKFWIDGFVVAPNKFEAMATHDAFVGLSSALKQTAVSLMKIANDIRLLSSGPRCGIGELQIPANEPGSSIMPGKVNPTQCEALSMVCCQVIGNDAAIAAGAMQGQLQLNVYMPLIISNILTSARLLADAVSSFNDRCMEGIKPNLTKIGDHLHQSLMLVTALSPHIGYYRAAEIAQYAHEHGTTLKEATLALNYATADEFHRWVKACFKC